MYTFWKFRDIINRSKFAENPTGRAMAASANRFYVHYVRKYNDIKEAAGYGVRCGTDETGSACGMRPGGSDSCS